MNKQKIKYFAGLVGIIGLVASPIIIGKSIRTQLDNKKSLEEKSWVESMKLLQEKEYSNSFHYINSNGYWMYGNDTGIGWSEKYDEKLNAGGL